MRVFLIIVSIFCLVELNAQTPYQGGSGDGFASASLSFDNVGLNANFINKLSVYPTIVSHADKLTFQNIKEVQMASIIAIDGKSYTLSIDSDNSTKLPDGLAAGVYTVLIISDLESYSAKIVVQ